MKNLFFLLSICLITVQCNNSFEVPAFQGAGSGIFPVLTFETDPELDLSMVESAAYEYCITFVDMGDGSSATLYEIEAAFIDNNPANGDVSMDARNIQTLSEDDFFVNNTGVLAVCPSIALIDLLAEFNLSIDDVNDNDQIDIKTYITNSDGVRIGTQNSMAITSGVSFDVHFDFSIILRQS